MKATYDDIYKDVQQIIRECETRNPKEIIKQRGIHLVPFPYNTTVLGMYKVIHRNRFVFYNPYIDERILNMVFAHELGHDVYHKVEGSKNNLIEYEIFDFKSSMEVEANIFAAHLLLDEDELFTLKVLYTLILWLHCKLQRC